VEPGVHGGVTGVFFSVGVKVVVPGFFAAFDHSNPSSRTRLPKTKKRTIPKNNKSNAKRGFLNKPEAFIYIIQ